MNNLYSRDNVVASGGKQSAATPDDNVLVLEVPLGTTRVVLARKRYGDRYVHYILKRIRELHLSKVFNRLHSYLFTFFGLRRIFVIL